jgi:sodium transport system permease protein
MLFIVFIVMSATAVWMIRASAKMLNQERLITSNESDAADLAGGAALFPKHVSRWFALLWIIMFVAAANIPQLATFRRQLLFNGVLLFLGSSLIMVRWYRIDIKQAWALRMPKAAVWPAILLLIPSANIMGIGVFRVASLILPVPAQMIEQFSQSIMPKELPVWQMIFFLAVLPAVSEEIAFRGTLLYGLRHRFHPAVLAVVVGIIFGLFHVSYFRIIPTGFLGIILTAVVLLTGSIFPSMALHFGNNAFSYLMSRWGSSTASMTWWAYLIAMTIFALCFYIIYRNRTPYPELRRSNRK